MWFDLVMNDFIFGLIFGGFMFLNDGKILMIIIGENCVEFLLGFNVM